MFAAIKGLLGSKKFWMAILGSVAVTVLQQFGVSQEILMAVAGFFGVAIAGQGMADFGKNKATPPKDTVKE